MITENNINVNWFKNNSFQRAIELHPHLKEEELIKMYDLSGSVIKKDKTINNGDSSTDIGEGAESECELVSAENIDGTKPNNSKKPSRATK